MLIDKEILRLIFGLKLRSIREEKKLSLKELSKISGLSPSYLNEIEKGKKYPKTEKIIILAQGLNEKYENLISLELKKEFQTLKSLLDQNILKKIPLNSFGIPVTTLFELMANEPEKMSYLVGSLLEIARAHNISVDDIFYAILRSHIDINQNYFPDIEKKSSEIFQKYNFANLTFNQKLILIQKILSHDYKVKIYEEEFEFYNKRLKSLAYFTKNDGKKLFLSRKLNDLDKIFILAREYGHKLFKHDQAPTNSLITNFDSYEELYNHFEANYFALGLLIPFDFAKNAILEILKSPTPIESLKKAINESGMQPDALIQRFSQILPKEFNLNQIFFLRYEYDQEKEKYQISRELHLSSLHGPHRIKGNENYCLRWIISQLSLKCINGSDEFVVGIQRSNFVDNQNEYLILACSFKNPLEKNKTTSVCIGILINEHAKKIIPILNTLDIQSVQVGETCERCSIIDCKDRKKDKEVSIEEIIESSFLV